MGGKRGQYLLIQKNNFMPGRAERSKKNLNQERGGTRGARYARRSPRWHRGKKKGVVLTEPKGKATARWDQSWRGGVPKSGNSQKGTRRFPAPGGLGERTERKRVAAPNAH